MDLRELKDMLEDLPEEALNETVVTNMDVEIIEVEFYVGGYCCSDHLPRVILKTE